MIKVVFVRRTPEESWLNNVKTYWVDNRDCSEIWRFKHCYIIAGNKRITNRHDAAVEELSEEELANELDTSKNELVVIEMPVSAEWIIRKRLSIRHKYWVDKRGYARTWEHHFNPLAFAGTAYTCSNMVGKLLGWNDFYALEPDDIYNRPTAIDLKSYYNHPHERLELSEEEAVVDNKVFNLSQRVDEELGIRLLEVNTY